MDLGLAGKTVIVTGGGSNIGRGITLAFAREGSNIAIAELDEAQGQKVANEAKSLGAASAVVIKTDVTKNDSVVAMVQKVLQDFGKIDVLVNNVGWTFDRLFIEKPREEWVKEVDLNLWGPINCIRAVLDHMIERRAGAIVSLGSDAGRMGEFREAVYGACKGGVIALTKAISREVGRYGIRLNVVCPGMTVPESTDQVGQYSMWKSPMFTEEQLERASRGYPLRKLGRPSDIGNAVVFLASDCAGHITGQTLSVSGGYTMM